MVWLIESSPLRYACCHFQLLAPYASPFRHFIIFHLGSAMLRKRRPPRSFQNTRKCVDRINLGNDWHHVNTNNFPSPLGKLTSAAQWTFPSSDCTHLTVESARKRPKWTRGPEKPVNIIFRSPSSIVDIFMVGHRCYIDSLSVRTNEQPHRRVWHRDEGR